MNWVLKNGKKLLIRRRRLERVSTLKHGASGRMIWVERKVSEEEWGLEQELH